MAINFPNSPSNGQVHSAWTGVINKSWKWDGTKWNIIGGDGGSGFQSSFLSLTDTPSSFTADKWIKVNAAGNALELTNAPSGGGGSTTLDKIEELDSKVEITDSGSNGTVITTIDGTVAATLSANSGVAKFTLEGDINTSGSGAILDISGGGSGVGNITFQNKRTTSGTNAYELPLAYPTSSGYVLSSTTGGEMSWVANSGGGITMDSSIGSIFSISGSGVFSAGDPEADKILFWDDSAQELRYLMMGTNIAINGTTLNVSGGSASAGGSANYIQYNDGSNGFAGSSLLRISTSGVRLLEFYDSGNSTATASAAIGCYWESLAGNIPEKNELLFYGAMSIASSPALSVGTDYAHLRFKLKDGLGSFGTSGQFLRVDTNGNTKWETYSGGGGGSSLTYDLLYAEHSSSSGSGTGNDAIIRLRDSSSNDDDVYLVAGSNVTLSHDTSSKKITIAASGGSGGGGATDKIEEGNTSVECIDTGTDGNIVFKTEGSTTIELTTLKQLKVYGTQTGNNVAGFYNDTNYFGIFASSNNLTNRPITLYTASGTASAALTVSATGETLLHATDDLNNEGGHLQFENSQGNQDYAIDVYGGNSGTAGVNDHVIRIIDQITQTGGTGTQRFCVNRYGAFGIGHVGSVDYGSSNEVLVSQGENLPPKWDTVSGGGGGSGETNQNAFSNVAVSGQNTVAADSKTDTLNLIAGNNITITTDTAGGADNITINSTGGGGSSLAIGTNVTDVLSISSSEIVADDAGADKLVFWDDSAGKLTYLTVGSNLTVTGTTITASGSGGGGGTTLPSYVSTKFLTNDGTNLSWDEPCTSRTAITIPAESYVGGETKNKTFTGFKSYALFKILTTNDAWVRLYTDSTSANADSSRLEGTDPAPGAGVIAEVIGNGTFMMSPGVIGFNGEANPTTTMYAAVKNRSSSSASISVSFQVLQLEA